MTYILSPSGVRTALLGVKVDRATATLPQNTTGNIFTVAGGRVLLTSLVGEVTTAFGATVTTLSIGVTPTVGNAVTTCLGTSLVVTSFSAGTHLVASTSGAVGNDNTNQNGLVVAPLNFLVPLGNVTITTSASDTGSVKWSITYIPYDDAGVITAA